MRNAMRNTILSTTALVLFTSGSAIALESLETSAIVAEFSTAQKIEISRGLLRTRVEVVIDGKLIELVYDNTTFQEVSREESPLSARDIADLEDEGIEIEIEDETHDDRDDDDDLDDGDADDHLDDDDSDSDRDDDDDLDGDRDDDDDHDGRDDDDSDRDDDDDDDDGDDDDRDDGDDDDDRDDDDDDDDDHDD